MKTNHSIKASILAIIITLLISTFSRPVIVEARSLKDINLKNTSLIPNELKIKSIRKTIIKAEPKSILLKIDIEELRQIKRAEKKALELEKKKQEEAARKAEEERQNQVVYDGLSYKMLVEKLNRSLNSTLSGKGEAFANYALKLGIDPYLAVAIVLHETGCKWNCSTLLKQCNNVGGMKGSPGCNGGSYKAFSSLEEGIEAYMNNLYNNYYSKGLTSPETIGPKYAASNTWVQKINTYINEIKAN